LLFSIFRFCSVQGTSFVCQFLILALSLNIQKKREEKNSLKLFFHRNFNKPAMNLINKCPAAARALSFWVEEQNFSPFHKFPKCQQRL
jgi:hypothetical protein